MPEAIQSSESGQLPSHVTCPGRPPLPSVGSVLERVTSDAIKPLPKPGPFGLALLLFDPDTNLM